MANLGLLPYHMFVFKRAAFRQHERLQQAK